MSLLVPKLDSRLRGNDVCMTLPDRFAALGQRLFPQPPFTTEGYPRAYFEAHIRRAPLAITGVKTFLIHYTIMGSGE
jgi:hypothetical protein